MSVIRTAQEMADARLSRMEERIDRLELAIAEVMRRVRGSEKQSMGNMLSDALAEVEGEVESLRLEMATEQAWNQ